MKRRLYLDLHVIHSYPLSCLNRDDLNVPKTAFYGGEQRGRISSQSGKRHVRVEVEDRLGEWAVRTKRLPESIAAELVRAGGWEEELAQRAGRMVVLAAGVKGVAVDGDNDTNSMLLLPKAGIAELAAVAVEQRELIEAGVDKKKEEAAQAKLVKAAGERVLGVLRGRTSSIAAFGRMLANEPGSAVAGAVQVAHQLTTHALAVQPDYFTAVDDITRGQEDESGSAHLGTAFHTSGTYYRYSSVNLPELAGNLGDDAEGARRVAVEFARAFAVVVPSARQGSTAPFTPPSLVHAVLRGDQPVNLGGAFERPVAAERGSGFVEPSVRRLDEYAAAVNGFLGEAGVLASAYTGLGAGEVEHLGEDAGSLEKLLATVDAAIGERL
ncbi:type I-E CRISPR-associated protein Cas7/Cse4/CasC [Kitasatospora brasiliensis]|uniref:type I-E CRISPR-associated protein Cas7/Cse4/CasC n=1 Tax=Kitasatospora brasiliensis TaxID=3058040 RepID=UPI00292DFF4E|nr:type I-E CRISPR-associated protein Cas7/Cse4/CasC [Kitasatospora sp. K002]